LLAFVLVLYSTNERKHAAHGLLNLANFNYDDVLHLPEKEKISLSFVAE
jgi:hypothetical protein